MSFYTINDLAAVDMAPGLGRRAVYLDKVMLTFVDFEPGIGLPRHSHPHEQITLVLEGTVEFTLDDETRILEAGQGVTVASNVPHSARSLDGSARVLDAWHPVREDYK
ncbi:MAG: cupin domain-containing protein [Candidatus Promineifilaceae bacterium]|nr:cupin domain-containing protein [Candidatus Promineifilaceae bacterium]